MLVLVLTLHITLLVFATALAALEGLGVKQPDERISLLHTESVQNSSKALRSKLRGSFTSNLSLFDTLFLHLIISCCSLLFHVDNFYLRWKASVVGSRQQTYNEGKLHGLQCFIGVTLAVYAVTRLS